MDCSPPGSSVHGIFQAGILEWVAISFSRGSSRPRDWTPVSCVVGRFVTIWATREAPFYLFQFSSVTQLCPTLCNNMDCSTPGFPVHYPLPELTQTHVHLVIDAIQPSHSVNPFSCLQSFPASGSFLLSQFFASGGQNNRASALVSVLPINIQDWFPLGLTGLIFLQYKGLSRVFNTTVQKHQFFGA